ncbi:hypothetical protein EU803_09765 [Loktanella sp. IMCC34160]|uniref:hypothetical protein n=1 Tax=Loktanella sp. IMCC34160 TaxID=2510646 RepID=UPI00101CCC31|nr:hypothetical protein [Loktanella sp. IMCC34160]RYG91369.1 hypothetical protein EU803_09765 [Loktanella sp. IMCC34160]
MTRWNQLLEDPRLRQISRLPFDKAEAEAKNFIAEVGCSLPAKVLALLTSSHGAEPSKVSEDTVDHLDRLYFELEDAGEEAESRLAFSAARLASAYTYLRDARTTDDLMHAVYEAHHAAMSSK